MLSVKGGEFNMFLRAVTACGAPRPAVLPKTCALAALAAFAAAAGSAGAASETEGRAGATGAGAGGLPRAARELVLAAAAGLGPAGHLVHWDRHVAAWGHLLPAGKQPWMDARARAARMLAVRDPARLGSLSLARLGATLAGAMGPGFQASTTLERLVGSGRADVVFFADTAGLARSVRVLADSERLPLAVDPAIGMMRLGEAPEHRMWLTDLLARVVWTGEGCVVASQAVFARAREAIRHYGRIRELVQRAVGERVAWAGPELSHAALPPSGSWGYQEMLAEGLDDEGRIRLLLAPGAEPLGGVLTAVLLAPGPAAAAAVSPDAPLVTRPGQTFQTAYVVSRGDSRVWLTARMAQERGWDLAAIDARVARDRARVTFAGVTAVPEGMDGKALLVAGPHAAALALYPATLRLLASEAFPRAIRVRARAWQPGALALTDPAVAPERIARLEEPLALLSSGGGSADGASGSGLRPPSGPGGGERFALDMWVDLPRAGAGRAVFRRLARERSERSPMPASEAAPPARERSGAARE
jgi:hypothetical protein